ncbi:MAG: group II intron reverse transcriptase/maturase [Proteobacteria bacterium]|nr:group II intron reverse transcriptase/maturase [Pseudomonadota bacterium]
MRTDKGRQVRQRTSNREAEVKPRGLGAKAEVCIASQASESLMFGKQLMEDIGERNNLKAALKRVRRNKGSPGVDGMTVDELPAYLKTHWLAIKASLQEGRYQPQAVRRVEIPKPGSTEKRKLGIPCVLDRFIQQAILQVLQRQWDQTFADSSYGFRPGRSAHQAIAKAQSYIKAGYEYVVDIDLEKFFDQVNHDRLMSRLALRIADKRVLKLIRAYLRAGILEHGLVSVPTEGTPQGGPLSPFLSNVVLDELDKELESRGHRYVRYADDCNIYVCSRRAGDRVMESVSKFITRRLKLKVNEGKSAVDMPRNRTFLGYTFTGGKSPNRRKIAAKSIQRFRAEVRRITRRNWSISLEDRIERLSRYITGWRGYYGYCETASVLRDLDSWIRRRLRNVVWKQWKVYRKRKRALIKLGINEHLAQTTAWSAKGPWCLSHSPGVNMALNKKYFAALGLPRLEPC